jgi:hypothetical protein
MIVTLDTIVITTVSALPTPAASLAGALVYYAGAIYYCNGTSWIPMGQGGMTGQDELKIDYAIIEM